MPSLATHDDRALEQRVYAGVLGKIIGVYLGRPVEMWERARIRREVGAVEGYLADRLGVPLVVVDDDISATFAFLRAAEGLARLDDLTAANVAACWLNELIEHRTTLWWGGFGNATEHTAFRRLEEGVEAPRSGSSALNGDILANQIGGQIFIDGWAMLAAGQPDLAARLARTAASVSHDGAALDAAGAVAAMQAAAFATDDIEALFAAARAVLPTGSAIAAIHDAIASSQRDGQAWDACMDMIEDRFGTRRFPGNCHVVPNHAVFAAAVRYGGGDFSRSICLAVQAGWDTDSNAGNVGCLLGIRNGLAAFEGGVDWRGPVADRLAVVSSDGASAITDALSLARHIVALKRRLSGLAPPDDASGPRYRFSQAGAVQGFKVVATSPDDAGGLRLCNRDGDGLFLTWDRPIGAASIATATFIEPDHAEPGPYEMHACPSVYPGQIVQAAIDDIQGTPRLALSAAYGLSDGTIRLTGPAAAVEGAAALAWTLPDLEAGAPILGLGLTLSSDGPGCLRLRALDVGGAPAFDWQPDAANRAKGRSWIAACDHFWGTNRHGVLRMAQNAGTGFAFHGRRDWRDYRLSCRLRPWLATRYGLIVAGQGLRRHIAVEIENGRLIVTRRRDRDRVVLFDGALSAPPGHVVSVSVALAAEALVVEVEGERFEVAAPGPRLRGHVGLCCTRGTLDLLALSVAPLALAR